MGGAKVVRSLSLVLAEYRYWDRVIESKLNTRRQVTVGAIPNFLALKSQLVIFSPYNTYGFVSTASRVTLPAATPHATGLDYVARCP